MAAMILSQVGTALLGPVGGFLGALAGARLDALAVSALSPAQVQPSRLASLSVQASQEGAPIPLVLGRGRLTGQVIWASKFKETSTSRRVGGKAGRKVVERHYSISFAVGLCAGPMSGLGQVWANGDPLDLTGLAWRFYPGTEEQGPDPLIEAIEGLDRAPAHKGLAYVVFEDFPLDGFGDRIPQLSFEVHARDSGAGSGGSLEQLAQAVNLIPACGEFAYAVSPVRKVIRPGREAAENLTVSPGRSDFMIALDQLQRDLPNVSAVSLAVAWFGTDLRCGVCQITPRCETATKQTRPLNWMVAGLTRQTAPKVTAIAGRPALGGTPTDVSVVEAITELKRWGFKVTLNPFLMMDIPGGNALPDPSGAASQPAYPWRGRITCHPAPGRPGSPDQTATADGQVAAFFGAAQRAQMTVAGGMVQWAAGTPWGYRRFVLHLAGLAKAAGGVDSFLLGSELVALTRVRGAGGGFAAVEALRALAGDVRAILGEGTAIGYGADWTEYGAQVPADDPAGLMFPLDSLWADPLIGFVGLDWYPPLTDQRPGEARPGLSDIRAGQRAGEAFDWYYASEAARQAGTRSPITDGAHGEPWVYRQKDLHGWWSHAHHPRSGGTRASTPTAWQPGLKPVRLMELGFGAVDRAANRPSAFPDPKSAENALPPFSTGARDDMAQRIALEASLGWWAEAANNPVSPVTGLPMVDIGQTHLWCWDARPFPHFPVRQDLWSDGAHAATGHWLAGRAGSVSLARVAASLAAQAGVALDVSGVGGTLEGYVHTGGTARQALETLAVAFGLELGAGPDGALRLATAPPADAAVQLDEGSVVRAGAAAPREDSRESQAARRAVRVSYYDGQKALRPATVGQPGASGALTDELAVPVVCDGGLAGLMARRLGALDAGQEAQLRLSPLAALRHEPNDRVRLPGLGTAGSGSSETGRVWRFARLSGGVAPQATLVPAPPAGIAPLAGALPLEATLAVISAAPLVRVLDLPAPWSDPAAPRPLVAVCAEPWGGTHGVRANGTLVAEAPRRARLGALVDGLAEGPAGRVLPVRPQVELWFGALDSGPGQAALLDGAGTVVDVISWRGAGLTGPSRWRLAGVVRGLGGAAPAPAVGEGCELVVLDDALVSASLPPGLAGTTIAWSARPGTAAPGDDSEAHLDSLWQNSGVLPWSPVHVRARRTTAGIEVHFIRRARGDGDALEPADVPASAATPLFKLRIYGPASELRRTLHGAASPILYPAADELTDFGAPVSALAIDLVQVADDQRPGFAARMATLPVLPG
jgi:hypothetical protein